MYMYVCMYVCMYVNTILTLLKRIGLDIMSSKVAHVQIPTTKAFSDSRHLFPVQVSCGSTMTACVTNSGAAFIWGSGFGPLLRIPTQLSVS
jgi:hypothetical protein